MISFLLSIAGIIHICSAFSVHTPTSRSLSSRPLVGFETIERHYHQPTELRSSALSSNGDLLPGISVIDDTNGVIFQQMEILQDSLYFRLFCVDILASCEYMPQELFECYSETCEVYPVDDEEVCLE